MGKRTALPSRRSLRAKKKVDYAGIEKRYDKHSFISTRKPRAKVIRINAGNGRAHAAPPLTSWPPNGMHQSVTYYSDVSTPGWGVRATDEIFMPFASLDMNSGVVWQGLEQEVQGLGADACACQHFDHLTVDMRQFLANTRITECVGEAAAAIWVLEQRPGFRMIWGYHIHSGTGIDQIWERTNMAGGTDFLIVEAKGPGAGLNFSAFLPPNYGQMEEGWVANHLYSMSQNNHAAGQRIVNAMGLQFRNAYPNYKGATKSYYGLANTSGHKLSPSRVFGIVVQANWLSDGRLSYGVNPEVQYFT